MPLDKAEICARYSEIYTGAVVDTLDEMGYDRQTLPSNINALSEDMHVEGFAYPVRGQPDRSVDFEQNLREILTMLSEAPDNSVAVYDTGDEEAAHIGELSTLSLKKQGCRGAVVDGGVRDVTYILDQDFPVFTRYRTPADGPPRWRLEDWDVPVNIGKTEIPPGDFIVGDADGVVVVPQEVIEDVLVRAEDTVNDESSVRDAVRDGVSPIDAYEEYGAF